MNRLDQHPIATGIIVACGLLILGLAGTEIALAWLRDPASPESRFVTYDRQVRLREWRPNTWWEYIAPQALMQSSGGAARAIYRIETDQDGFIKPARVHATADVTIVFLGGSTTECMYVDPDNRFPYLAGRFLEADTGLMINSFNGGKAGNNVTHINTLLTSKVLPLRPDYVVLMEGVNDMGLLNREGTYWVEWDTTFNHLLRRELSFEGIVTDLRNLLIPRTYEAFRIAQQNFGLRMRSATRAGEARAAETPPEARVAAPSVDSQAQSLARDISAYQAALTQFVATAKAWGITPILMTQLLQGDDVSKDNLATGNYLDPDRLAAQGLSAQSAKQRHATFNAALRDVARREDIRLIDLDALIPADATTLYDGMHLHDAGSRRVAAVIAAQLAEAVQNRNRPIP